MAFTYTTRKDGRLMKKVTIDGKPKYIYSDNPKDLEKQYIELKHNSINNIVVNDSIKMKDFALKWIELNSTNKEYGTLKEYKYLINNHIIPSIGLRKIKDIKQSDIKQMMKNLESTPTTAKKTLQLTKRILNEAIDNDIIIKNVAQSVKAPKIIRNEKIPLTIEEDNKLLSSTSKYAPFFILMRYTGMRREEIVPLTINDIDLISKTIYINKAVTFIKNKPNSKTTKNRKPRYVPLLDCVYDIVENLVNEAKANNRKLLFVTETSKTMLTESAIKRHLESFLHSLDNINFTCHQLRHSYCTMLYYADVKLKKAQELMGHSGADMVYNIYTHLDNQRENAEDSINKYISETYSVKSCQKSCQK